MPRTPILDGSDKLPEEVIPTRLSDANIKTNLVEHIQDTVAAMFDGGHTNWSITYNDTTGKLTAVGEATGTGGTGGLDAEGVRDTIQAALRGIDGITVNEVATDDTANTITIGLSGVAMSNITGLEAALDGKASASGSINQFSDVSNATASDDNILMYDADTASWQKVDPYTKFAQADPSTRRLAATAYPKYYRDIVVVNAGEQPPADTPLGAIIFTRPAAPSMTPVMLAQANNTASSGTLVITVPETLAVGDTVGIALMATGEVGPGAWTNMLGTWSAGAGAITWALNHVPNGTAGVALGQARVTSQIAAGSTLTLTFRDATNTTTPRVLSLGCVFRMPNIAATSPLDQVAIGGGTNSANMSAVQAGPTSSPTSQPNELALAVAGWSSLVAPANRDVNPTGSWQTLVKFATQNTANTSARSLLVAYRVLTSVESPQLTTTATSTDGGTGAWATGLATYKAV